MNLLSIPEINPRFFGFKNSQSQNISKHIFDRNKFVVLSGLLLVIYKNEMVDRSPFTVGFLTLSSAVPEKPTPRPSQEGSLRLATHLSWLTAHLFSSSPA